ncbi:hypothetical protein TRAPUB_10757, partial [Trametes pubescens]
GESTLAPIERPRGDEGGKIKTLVHRSASFRENRGRPDLAASCLVALAGGTQTRERDGIVSWAGSSGRPADSRTRSEAVTLHAPRNSIP